MWLVGLKLNHKVPCQFKVRNFHSTFSAPATSCNTRDCHSPSQAQTSLVLSDLPVQPHMARTASNKVLSKERDVLVSNACDFLVPFYFK